MSYYRLFYKMFQYNQKKFLLYFLCDSFVVCVLYILSGFILNESFMDPDIIDPYISHDVYAPGFLILLFSVFFIPYSHEAFNRQQRQDHAILLSIGGEEKIILSKIFIENSLVAILSIAVGIAIGVCCSIGIHYYIIHNLGISGLRYGSVGKTCIFIIVWFALLYGVSIFLQLIYNQRQTILTLIKDNKIMRIGLKGHKFLLVTGILLLGITLVYMLIFFDQNHNNNLAICYLTGAIGLTLIVFNSTVMISFIKKHSRKFYYKHIFIISDIEHRFQSSKKIVSLAVCILGLAIFFQAFPFATLKIDERDLNNYYPYDIAYASIYGMNSLDRNEIQQIAAQENVTITKNQTLEYLSYNGMTLLPVERVNKIMERSYHIKKGQFISIYQEVENDGRIHQYSDLEEVNIPLKDEKQIKLGSAGHEEDILVGNISTLAGVLTLVNDEDYGTIKDHAKACDLGTIHMLDCSNLQESGRLADSLQAALYKDNAQKGDDDRNFYKAEVKYDGAIELEQAHDFMLFLFTIMDVLLYFAVIVMLHFKFMMNFDTDKKMLSSLVKIGTTSDELSRLVKHNLYIMFMFPLIIAILGAIFFGYILFDQAEVGKSYLLYSSIISLVIFVFQLAICIAYNKFYIKKVFGKSTEN